MPDTVRNFLFTELTADSLSEGREFDGLVPLDNVRDMYGQPVTIKAEELPTYLANTLAAIEATRSESGELVGLPIDAAGHDKGDGAGWITGLARVGNLLRFVPKWTEIGTNLIGKSIRRFFSPTVDTVNKVILGGSLTNWPASRNKQGHTLLRPIELSATLFQLADESLDERTMNIRRAFYDATSTPEMSEPYICEVFDGYVIARAGESLFKVPYTEGDNGIEFSARSEWAEVKQSYVEAAFEWVRGLFKQKPAPPKQGVLEMEITLEKLKELIVGTVKEVIPAAPAQPVPAPDATPAPALPADLAAVLGVNVLSEKGKAELATWMTAQAKAVQEQAQLAFNAQMARISRENTVTELAQRITGGSTEAPRGIKGATAEDMKKHLLALPADESKWFGELLAGIVKDGLTEFAEIGHGRQLQGVAELAEPYAGMLREWVANKGDVAEFFTINARELGEMKTYNLAAFAPKEK